MGNITINKLHLSTTSQNPNYIEGRTLEHNPNSDATTQRGLNSVFQLMIAVRNTTMMDQAIDSAHKEFIEAITPDIEQFIDELPSRD